MSELKNKNVELKLVHSEVSEHSTLSEDDHILLSTFQTSMLCLTLFLMNKNLLSLVIYMD
jgi:hypothetical protein